jgi:hypothetical protein
MDATLRTAAPFPFVAGPALVARPADVPPGPIVAEGRLLDVVAARDVVGTLDEIARLVQVGPDDLVAALAELTEVGWVSAEPTDDGRVLLRLADDAR